MSNESTPKMIVAEGDSWFALSKKKKLKIPIRWFKDITDVLNELKKIECDGKKCYKVKSSADTGHTIGSMAYSESQFKDFKDLLEKHKPKVILLSGGGNDITGKVLEMMLNDKRSDDYSPENSDKQPLNRAIVRQIINVHIRKAYKKLLCKINSYYKDQSSSCNRKEIPVLVHGYAYSIPNGDGFGVDIIPGMPGPWLEPAFENRGYTCLDERACIMKKLNDQFNCMLKDLESCDFSNISVTYVNLRQCWNFSLEKSHYKKYWDDELHPSIKGFRRIAEEFHEVIKTLNCGQ